MTGLVSTEHIGSILKQKYGKSDQNEHIDYFYLRVGDEIAGNVLEIPPVVDPCALKGTNNWVLVGPGLFVQEFKKQDHETERQLEQRLNVFRKDLTTHLRSPAGGNHEPSKVHVMFYRACLYYKYCMPVQSSTTTDQIEAILDVEYGTQNPQDLHIDFFYITIYNYLTELDILPLLKTLPGDWRQVGPYKTWGYTFIGYFPKKTPFETERKREQRLDREVRIPLKGNLEKQQSTQRPDLKTNKVHVVLGRACKCA